MTKISLVYNFETEEELRAHLALEQRSEPARNPEAQTAAEVEEEADEPDAEVSRDSVDADGMPYNADFHSDPPTVTAKGLWRAKRGKTAEADAARAAFKANGGNVEPPADVETRAAEPVVAPTLPGVTLPGLPVSAPEPVSMSKLAEKIGSMMQRGVLDAPTASKMYTTVTGATDANAAMAVFNTNETARANLYTQLLLVEPDL